MPGHKNRVMASLGSWKDLFRRRRWPSRPREGVTLILMYHRVVEIPSDPQLLAVSPAHFLEHMDVLSESAVVLRLGQLVEALRYRTIPDRAVVLTFDDGYADNLYFAAPLLARCAVPATVFVAANHVGRNHEFWWDDLERILLLPSEIPARLHLKINGSEYRWSSSQATNPDTGKHRNWNIERRGDPTLRHRLYRDLYHRIHSLDATERGRIFDELRAWAGVERSPRPTHRIMTRPELRQLAEREEIDIGAHTLTHPSLAEISLAKQEQEIAGSKRMLEDIVRREVTSFAYPHGSFSRDTIGCVKAAGFESACTSEPMVVLSEADPYQLPRVVVRDWDGDEFSRRLEAWFGS